jgi:hypothetical protein
MGFRYLIEAPGELAKGEGGKQGEILVFRLVYSQETVERDCTTIG